MITISPQIPPYKSRIKTTLRLLAVLVLLIILYFIVLSRFNIKLTFDQDSVIFATFFGGSVVFLISIVFLSQIWILNAVIIDEQRRKIKIEIMRFDRIVDKGEYNIDEKLKIKIGYKYAGGGQIPYIVIKYGRKRIFAQSTASLGGVPSWNDQYFQEIKRITDSLRQVHESYAWYTGNTAR